MSVAFAFSNRNSDRDTNELLLTLALENDGNDKTVDTEDTSHNDWNEGLENEIALENTDGGNTNT